MALVQASLRPQGVAYVSYNALPGCRIREMFRDMMLFHVRGLEESGDRLNGRASFWSASWRLRRASSGRAST